jgi:type IV pilus assembly protein PilV
MGKCKQTGSSLVEVMVALFVLAIGLLGVLGMQAKSMQYNQSAHVYTQAVYLANDIAERIRSNPAAANDYTGALPVAAPQDCSINYCDKETLAEWDRVIWAENIKNRLPAGVGAIALIPADGDVQEHLKITVSFDDSRSDTPPTAVDDGEEEEEAAKVEYAGPKVYALVVEI